MGSAWQLQNPDAKLWNVFLRRHHLGLWPAFFIVSWMFALIALLGRALPVGHAVGQAVYEILLSFWLEFPFKWLSHGINLFLLMYPQCPTEVIKQVVSEIRKGEDRTGVRCFSQILSSPFLDLGENMKTLIIYWICHLTHWAWKTHLL